MNLKISDLSENDQLLVTGEDSARFLQGQLTCDIDALTDSNFSYGAVCNTKGRIISTFIISRLDDEKGFILELGQGMAESLSQHLSKYKVFYKTDIQDISDSYKRYGLFGSDVTEFLADNSLPEPHSPFSRTSKGNIQLLRLPNDQEGNLRVELLVRTETSAESQIQNILNAKTSSMQEWTANGLRNGFFLLQPEHVGEFTPEELSLDLLNAISFTKGCYTGQEIVARMHYRGKAKKRLFFFTTNTISVQPTTDHKGYFLSDKNLTLIRERKPILLILNEFYLGLSSIKVDLSQTELFLCHDKMKPEPIQLHGFL